ncbi:hypothetical protein D6C91_10324 [Aureobasidium pullulans]|uniref:Uncharacterized protein n=1 Tax=Aureobasidium pullulans TaxID=5580 RepID=A0A4S9S9R0_AURPU|nr:hypothetical protein D6C91_10324 [Aureobasidium pullulans]
MSHHDPLGTVNELFRLLAPDARVVWERDDKGEINHVKYNTIEAASKVRDAVMEQTNKNDVAALKKIEEDHLAEELVEEKPSRDALADYYAAMSDAIRNNTAMPEPYTVSDDSDSESDITSETGDVEENKKKKPVHDTPGSVSKQKKVMMCKEDHKMPARTHQNCVEAREKANRSSKKRVAEEMEHGDVEENKCVRSIKKMKKKGKNAQK